MSNLLIILGNGFTIDFIKNIDKVKEIDPVNLFRLGEKVMFPGENYGFLSHQYCPALWQLGARPDKSNEESISIIEEIITCSNMFFEYMELNPEEKTRMTSKEHIPIYMNAYMEFLAYIKQLFIDYNKKINHSELEKFINEDKWGWIDFFKNSLCNDKYEKVTIITYNYDMWLERILKELKIKFSVKCFSGKNQKVEIIKPHGSISFIPKKISTVPYRINYDLDIDKINISTIKNCTTNILDHNKCYIIPPAGDSNRRKSATWAKRLRNYAVDAAKTTDANDDVIICGLSYWHVDRKELDELLINLNKDVNISFVNPYPPKDLNAVLMTLFKKYRLFRSSETLKGI